MNSFWRVIWFGVQGFRRNIWLSLVAVFTMSLMLTAITVFLLANLAARQAYKDFNNKIDYIIFLKDTASDADIEVLQQQVKLRPEVNTFHYSDKAEVMKNFETIFKNDESLRGVITPENNPLPREISITFSEVSKIKAFNEFVLDPRFSQVIEKTSYRDNEKLIENYLSFTRYVQLFGMTLTIFFVMVAVIVILNTIRLAIYARREEIEIMRLVGATWQYIRGPFLIEGVLYGLLGALFSAVAIWTLLYQLLQLAGSEGSLVGVSSFNMVSYYARSLLGSKEALDTLFNQLVLFQILLGVGLGVVCSAYGVRRYLKE
jgi:cell division transport system permease protein